MKITLDLETNKITAPKNFFDEFAKQNDMIKKVGSTPIDPLEVVKKSFETAMADPTSNFITRK